jgi:hypothetical protein
VYGNFAFVHYGYQLRYLDAANAEKSERGRWTDILMKVGTRWLCIGDTGGTM